MIRGVTTPAALARALEDHDLDPVFEQLADGGVRVRVAWPAARREHDDVFALAERDGPRLRRALQSWLLNASLCQLALWTRAGTQRPVFLQAKPRDFNRFDVEHACVAVWGVDPDLLTVGRYWQGVGVSAAA